MATKKKIADGIIKFIEADLLPGIEDRQLKFVLTMAKHSMKDPCVISGFFSSPMISAVIKDEGGEYDVSHLAKILKSVIDECGSYPVAIPKIPLLTDGQKVIRISSADIDRILMYIESETEEEE